LSPADTTIAAFQSLLLAGKEMIAERMPAFTRNRSLADAEHTAARSATPANPIAEDLAMLLLVAEKEAEKEAEIEAEREAERRAEIETEAIKAAENQFPGGFPGEVFSIAGRLVSPVANAAGAVGNVALGARRAAGDAVSAVFPMTVSIAVSAFDLAGGALTSVGDKVGLRRLPPLPSPQQQSQGQGQGKKDGAGGNYAMPAYEPQLHSPDTSGGALLLERHQQEQLLLAESQLAAAKLAASLAPSITTPITTPAVTTPFVSPDVFASVSGPSTNTPLPSFVGRLLASTGDATAAEVRNFQTYRCSLLIIADCSPSSHCSLLTAFTHHCS
jgi:hypothetical protein